MKYVKYMMAVLALAVALSAVSFEPKSVTESDFLLDTYVTVTVYGKNAKNAADAALERVRSLDRRLSAFYEESEISAINGAGANVPVSVSDECFYLIQHALALSEQTDGAFDITVKPAMDLWGFGSELQNVPSEYELGEVLDKVDFHFVQPDEETKSVTLLKDGMAIDLGGVAKGYCADAAAEVLLQEGAENFYLDFGGNVVTRGGKPLKIAEQLKYRAKTRPFVVGIQDPNGIRGDVFETVTTDEKACAVVTSGGYERYFEENGVRYHHILNPATGKQPDNGILSVTVTGSSSLVCDALSTALFVAGPDGCEKVRNLFREALFVYDTGEVKKIYSQGEK